MENFIFCAVTNPLSLVWSEGCYSQKFRDNCIRLSGLNILLRVITMMLYNDAKITVVTLNLALKTLW